MEKYFLCLANSFKHGGRCLAGIELVLLDRHWRIVRNENGSPRWLRPVSRYTNTGEIPVADAENIPVLSVVHLTGVEQCPHEAHSENVYYDNMETTGSKQELKAEILERLKDNVHESIFANNENSITRRIFAETDYSLMLIHLTDAEVYLKNKHVQSKPRLRFKYNGVGYDFPITDADYWERLRYTSRPEGKRNNLYVVLSLGLPFEERHYKLVATILDMDTNIATLGNNMELSSLNESRIKNKKYLYENSNMYSEDGDKCGEPFSNTDYTPFTKFVSLIKRGTGTISSKLKSLRNKV